MLDLVISIGLCNVTRNVAEILKAENIQLGMEKVEKHSNYYQKNLG